MNFLNPFFLFGLLAIAIPLVIHLINLRRPQKISFSTLSFIRELRKSTIRRIRFKQYLLMALRMLAVLCLALALAQPFLPPTITGSGSSGMPKAISIMIDNSASMQRVGSSGPLIEQSKEVARRIIQKANSDDRFLISTTNGNISPKALRSASSALSRLSDISIENTTDHSRAQFRSSLQKIGQAPQQQALSYIISDGQKSQFQDLNKLNDVGKKNKNIPIQLITVASEGQNNVAISSVSMKKQLISRGTPISLRVTVENTGGAPAVNQFISLSVRGERSGQYKFSLDPGNSRKFNFEVNPDSTGDLAGQFILEGDELTYDNRRNFVIRIPQVRSVLLVDGKEPNSSYSSYLSPALEAAHKTNAQLNVRQLKPSDVDQTKWENYDTIVLDGVDQVPTYWFESLQRYVQKGNGLLFLPSEKGSVENYNRFFSLFNAGQFTNVAGEYGSYNEVVSMAPLEGENPVLKGVFSKEKDEDLKVKKAFLFYYYQYKHDKKAPGLDILKASNGDPVLSEQQFGKGKLLVAALGADPGWSNLPVNPIFAPLFYRATLFAGTPERSGLRSYTLSAGGFSKDLDARSSDVMLTLNGTQYKPDVKRKAGGINLSYSAEEWQPGILTVQAGDKQYKIAVNQDIMESLFDTLTNQQWQQQLDKSLTINPMISAANISDNELEQKVNTAMYGREIWNWFIWMGLLLLIAETVLSRMYKTELAT